MLIYGGEVVRRVSGSVDLASVVPMAPRVIPLRMGVSDFTHLGYLVPSKVRNLGCGWVRDSPYELLRVARVQLIQEGGYI